MKYLNFTIIKRNGDDITLQCSCGETISYKYKYVRNKRTPKCTNIKCFYNISAKTQGMIKKYKLYIGQTIGNFTITGFSYDLNNIGVTRYIFKCTCNLCGCNDVIKYVNTILNNKDISCGCLTTKGRLFATSKYEAYVNSKIGRLLILELICHDNVVPHNRYIFKVKCDCGNIKHIRAASIITEHVTSCGCKKYRCI